MGWSGTPASGAVIIDGQVTIDLGTITTDIQNLHAVVTWNNAATVFTALKLDVSDTLHAAGSKLLSLRVGGLPVLWVNPDGTLNDHTIPAVAADTFVLLTATQTLTNKTLTTPLVSTLGPTLGQQHSLPAVSSDTIVLRTATQTLTNKTLTAPVLNGVLTTTGLTMPSFIMGSGTTLTLDSDPSNNLHAATKQYSDANKLTESHAYGSGAGNYSTSSASYTDVDGANLLITITPTTGRKILIIARGTVQFSVSATNQNGGVALTDGTTLLTESNPTLGGGGGVSVNTKSDFCLTYLFTGDGASHTFKLRYKVDSGSMLISNSSATLRPSIIILSYVI